VLQVVLDVFRGTRAGCNVTFSRHLYRLFD